MTMSEQYAGRIGGPTPPYASVGRRIGGWFLDGVVAGLVVLFLGVAPYLLTQKAALLVLGYVAAAALGIVQWILLAGRGFTIGKYLAGTRVVDADTGAPIGALRALLRFLVLEALSSCFLLLVVVVVLIGKDPRRQGWHDKAARSVEVEAGGERHVAAGATAAAQPGAPVPPPPGVTPGVTPGQPVSGPPAAPAPNFGRGFAPAPTSGPVPGPAAPSGDAPVVPPPPAASSAPVAPPPPAPLPAGGLVPPPPGLVSPPPRATGAQPPVSAAPPAPPLPPVSFDEVTRRPPTEGGAPRPVPQRWVLRPRVGEEMVVGGSVVVGRDPDTSQHPFAVPWRVDDPVFTVSKTHALVTLESGTPWIEDLDSTHGVVIRRGGDEVTIDPRTPTRLLGGDVVILGAFEITVEAS